MSPVKEKDRIPDQEGRKAPVWEVMTQLRVYVGVKQAKLGSGVAGWGGSVCS